MLAFLLVVCYHIGVKKTVKFDKFTVLFLTKSFGGLAQLVRASASHAEGQRFESAALHQISCLICLPDKSGNFLAFGAKTRKNTVKSEKTGFGMAITARPRPVFCVFRPKIPCTFYFKLTEQSSRKKLAVGGFEPEKVRLLYPAP